MPITQSRMIALIACYNALHQRHTELVSRLQVALDYSPEAFHAAASFALAQASLERHATVIAEEMYFRRFARLNSKKAQYQRQYRAGAGAGAKPPETSATATHTAPSKSAILDAAFYNQLQAQVGTEAGARVGHSPPESFSDEQLMREAMEYLDGGEAPEGPALA